MPKLARLPAEREALFARIDRHQERAQALREELEELDCQLEEPEIIAMLKDDIWQEERAVQTLLQQLPEVYFAERDAAFTHVYRWRKYLPERHGERCRLLARGKRNSRLIEFADGTKHIVSGWAVRRAAADA